MFAGKTVFITGASRGIGREIGIMMASQGANVAIAAKTATPHRKLKGTIYTAAEDMKKAGGNALPLIVDVRNEESVRAAIDETVQKFGGIDFLINNASAISLTPTPATSMKTYDLMHSVNARGTYLCSKVAQPHLEASAEKGNAPHILNISPPLDMNPMWFANHSAYTAAKYGMSLYAMGMAREFKDSGIHVNCLWPRTAIATAAVEMMMGKAGMESSRTPAIMAEAAKIVLDGKSSGRFWIDDEVLLKNGWSVESLKQFSVTPDAPLQPDFFIPGVEKWLAALERGENPLLKSKL